MNTENEHLEFFFALLCSFGNVKVLFETRKLPKYLDQITPLKEVMNLCLQPWEKLMQMATSM